MILVVVFGFHYRVFKKRTTTATEVVVVIAVHAHSHLFKIAGNTRRNSKSLMLRKRNHSCGARSHARNYRNISIGIANVI